jgi:hypothetical protein
MNLPWVNTVLLATPDEISMAIEGMQFRRLVMEYLDERGKEIHWTVRMPEGGLMRVERAALLLDLTLDENDLEAIYQAQRLKVVRLRERMIGAMN